MLLRLGTESKAVPELRGLMQRAGYLVRDGDLFDRELDRCVRTYQEDRGLAVDGIVVHGRGKTWPRLAGEPALDVRSDSSPRAARLSQGLAILYDSERRRMTPEGDEIGRGRGRTQKTRRAFGLECKQSSEADLEPCPGETGFNELPLMHGLVFCTVLMYTSEASC